eukprot:scaffold6635_cov179-Ochromonas_danica.AAC.1
MNLNPAALQDLLACINQIENEISDLLQIQADWVPDEQLNFAQFRETINDLRIVLGVHAANHPVDTINEIGVLLRSIERHFHDKNHSNDPPDLNQTMINDYVIDLTRLRAELVGVPDNHAGNEAGSWWLTILRIVLAVVAVTYCSHVVLSSLLRPTQDITVDPTAIGSNLFRSSFLSPIQNVIKQYTSDKILMPSKNKETGVKDLFEEKNYVKGPRRVRRKHGMVGGTNKRSTLPFHEDVSLFGEVASSNNDEGQRVLPVVDEGNHHNENNHWTSSMNDENNQGEANPSPPLSGGGAKDDGCSADDIQ